MTHITTAKACCYGAVLLAISSLCGGCGNSEPNGAAIQVAAAPPTPTAIPTPTPKPTPRPTAKRKTVGVALTRIHTKRKVFALTFDDGPDPSWTPKILKILKEKKVPATFFMVGQMVRAHGATAKLVVAAGHPVGNHSWSHPMKTRSPVGEIERTDAVIKRHLGVTPALFRPPYGLMKNGLARAASERGEDVILWSSDSADWNKHHSASQLKFNVLKNAQSGGIALMHDGGGNRAKTVAALPGIIDALHNRGYELVTVPELMAMGKPDKVVIGGARTGVVAKRKLPAAKPKH